MIKYSSLQSMTYYKDRLFLPYDENNKSKGTMFHTINMSHDEIVKLLNSDYLISNNGNYYNAYWYDYTLLPKSILTNRINNTGLTMTEARKNLLADLESISSKRENMKCPITLKPLSGRNFVYDLEPFVELYRQQEKLKNIYIVEKLSIFFNSLQKLVSHSIPEYKKTCIFVNLDNYNKYTEKSPEGSILYYLLLLFKRSNNIIDTIAAGKDMKFLFFTSKGYFLFDMSKDLTKSNYSLFTRLLKKLSVSVKVDKDVNNSEKEDTNKYIKQKSSNAMRTNLTGDISEELTPEEMEQDLIDNLPKGESEDGDIFGSEELKQEYLDAMNEKNTGKTTKSKASTERDKKLRENQKKVKVINHTIGEIKQMKDIPVLKEEAINNDNVTNPNMKTIKFSTFEKTYMEELYEKDVTNCITSLTDKNINVNIVDIKIEDTSDSLTMKETYTVILEDEYRRRHTLKFNLPKFIDDKFIYINGNKKIIQKQLFLYPVIKTAPNTVQICTNYQKIFIYRLGEKFNHNIIKFRKLLDEPIAGIKAVKGCNTSGNSKYLTCLEYDEFADQYNSITVGKATFVFNMEELVNKFGDKSDLNKIIVGYTSNNEPIFYDRNNEENQDFVSLMLSYASPEIVEKFGSYSTGKKFVYNSATIMSEKIPLIVLLCLFEGLETVIRKFSVLTGTTITFSDKKDKGDNYQYIKFSDGYLCYPLSNMEACILFNGFTNFNTSPFSFSDMNERITYYEILDMITNQGSYLAGGLMNYYQWMIDPITLEILIQLDYPTDFVSLAIFASNLLADNSYINDISLDNYRLRDNEIVSAILYKNIARAYSRYNATANNPNPVKISMNEDAVIKELLALPTVEDYSTLSPMVELHKSGLSSMKGPNGLNVEESYKRDKIAYDDSMIGVFGISTDAGPNVGKDRHLVAEPTIINARGFIKVTGRENVDELKDVNLATPVEMLTPMSSTRDEPARNAMATKQTSHVIPVEQNCPALISTGMDIMAHYRTSNDFSVVAKEDGKVIDIDDSVQIMIVQYKSGKKEAIDLSSRVVKNGGGGFYLNNQLTSRYKKGQTFKKDDILAYDKHYYRDIGLLGNRITVGLLTKVMVMSNYATYEDSSFITRYMSKCSATNITMPKSVNIGANANVDYIVKVGDYVNIGDDLIRYETSYDDSELNRLLSNVREDLKEDIVNLGKSAVTSSYAGVIQDIQILCTVELEELSPSLQKIVKAYQSNVKKRKKFLDKYDPDGKDSVYRMNILIDKADSKTIPDRYGKVKGQDIGRGVMIDFFVTYHNESSDGDKFAGFTANKNTIGYVIPEGYEPYSEFRPYEEISSVVAPSAILQRGTPSIMTTGLVYKVLIELKRKMYEILTGENYDEILKQKQPWMNMDEPVSESTELTPITESQIMFYETLFDLCKNDNGKYYSDKYIHEGQVILSIPPGINVDSMLENFVFNINGNAIRYDDMIKALTDIYPGDEISLIV